jgi:hypothetical protein
MAFNHPAIKKFLESPSRSSSPTNQRSETPSANHSESDSLSQHNDFLSDKDNNSNVDVEERPPSTGEQRPSRKAGRVQLRGGPAVCEMWEDISSLTFTRDRASVWGSTG